MSFGNIYHKRLVALTASKPCFICYKPTTTVLNQADSKDWFYVCPGHLLDKGFASPVIDQEAEKVAAEKKRKEALDEEIEVVKREWEERKKKKSSRKSKEKEGKEEEKEKKEEEEKEAKLKELEGKKVAGETKEEKKDEGPRVFELNKGVYQMRLQKLRDKQQSAQTQRLLRTPNAFPSVPGGAP